MIRAGCLTLALASPVAAEGLVGQALCAAVWTGLDQEVGADLPVSGTLNEVQDGWCVVEDVVLDLQSTYAPDWYIDRLRFRGGAFARLVDGVTPPDRLEIEVEGLRLVVQTGDPRMDWLFEAQSHPNRIGAELALAWDAREKMLSVERLWIDFPGDNLVEFSASAAGVDLSSPEAMSGSYGSLAIKEADFTVRTHGLFEWYALMSLGPIFLPSEGDMDAAARGLRSYLIDFAWDLPVTKLDMPSRTALKVLVSELPNPSGTLKIKFQSDKGMFPFHADMSYAYFENLETAVTTLLSDSLITIEWTHEDAP